MKYKLVKVIIVNLKKSSFIYLITGLYSIIYLLYIIITAIITAEFPNFEHNLEQGLSILFIFCLGALLSIIYTVHLYPDLRETFHGTGLNKNASPYEIVTFISTEEEVEVLEAIKELAPKAYKFEIARITELSRMKVHRILLRLSSRGIVDVKKDGKYSQIYLADWL